MENYREQLESIREELEAVNSGKTAEEIGEYFDFYDWIPENVKDVNYVINTDRNYISVILCLRFEQPFGGANIFIETGTQELRLFGNNGSESIPLPTDICDKLDEIYWDFYNEEPED